MKIAKVKEKLEMRGEPSFLASLPGIGSLLSLFETRDPKTEKEAGRKSERNTQVVPIRPLLKPSKKRLPKKSAGSAA